MALPERIDSPCTEWWKMWWYKWRSGWRIEFTVMLLKVLTSGKLPDSGSKNCDVLWRAIIADEIYQKINLFSAPLKIVNLSRKACSESNIVAKQSKNKENHFSYSLFRLGFSLTWPVLTCRRFMYSEREGEVQHLKLGASELPPNFNEDVGKMCIWSSVLILWSRFQWQFWGYGTQHIL